MPIHDDQELTQAARDEAVAAFLLSEAKNLGVRVGTDGENLVTVTTRRIPAATIIALEHELVRHKQAVIAAIVAENPDVFDAGSVS
jgi:hypothetical protein